CTPSEPRTKIQRIRIRRTTTQPKQQKTCLTVRVPASSCRAESGTERPASCGVLCHSCEALLEARSQVFEDQPAFAELEQVCRAIGGAPAGMAGGNLRAGLLSHEFHQV